MTTVSRTFDVRPEPAVVVGYLKDFGNAEVADPIMKIVFEKIAATPRTT
jgi:hypothetical protein